MTIDFPSGLEKPEDVTRFEKYLRTHAFKYKKKKVSGFYHFTVQIRGDLDAFWIGANLIKICDNLLP